jgi:hypothetical protein
LAAATRGPGGAAALARHPIIVAALAPSPISLATLASNPIGLAAVAGNPIAVAGGARCFGRRLGFRFRFGSAAGVLCRFLASDAAAAAGGGARPDPSGGFVSRAAGWVQSDGCGLGAWLRGPSDVVT